MNGENEQSTVIRVTEPSIYEWSRRDMHVILPAVLFALTSQVVPYTLERLELNVAVDYEHKRVDGVARLTIRNTSRESS